MKKLKFNFLTKEVLIFILLIVITLLTHYYGSTDIGDYSNSAKFFANKNNADIRSSHSYLYGFIHFPFLKLFNSYLIFKITSLVVLFLIVLSVYYISGKNKKAVWLMLFSPVFWYIAPWISPIQISGLCLLWSWFFMSKFQNTHNLKHLVFSGVILGVGWAFWDTILFFGAFLFLSFLFDKKLYISFIFILSILAGLLPRLLLDQYYFGFAFFSILKSTAGTFTNALFLGRGTSYSRTILDIFYFILVFVSFPIIFWRMYKKYLFIKRPKTMIFLSLSILLIFVNPQIRYTLVILPIMIVLVSKNIDEILFRKQIKFSLIVLILFILPTLVQINYSINNSDHSDITSVIESLPHFNVSSYSDSYYLKNDLDEITKEYPNEVFVVGNHQDYYQKLAHIYWGDKVREFVSIQDYTLWSKNESVLFEEKFEIKPPSGYRRSIWLGGGISRNTNDNTDFESIRYGLSLNGALDIEGFSNIKNYSVISLWEKK